MPRERVPGDLLPVEASPVIGGPLGRHAAARNRSAGRLLPLIVVMVALPMSLAVTRQGHCIANGWNGDEQFWRGCFSDLPAQYQLGGLDAGLAGWAGGQGDLEQMPLLSGLMALLGGVVPGESWLDASRWYVALWAVLITAAAAVSVWCVGRLRPGRLDLATQLALTPAYVVAALLSPDLLVVSLLLGAMLALQARRPTTAGVLLGLALLGHAWVWLAPVALLAAAPRLDRRPAAVRTVLVALAVVAVSVLALLALRPGLVLGPLRRWWEAPAGYGALVQIPELLGFPLPVWSVTVVALAGCVLAVLGAVLLARDAWRPATWAQVLAFALPLMVLLGKSLPVQAVLWLLPLAILAGISWRTHLGLVAVEAVHASALWLYIGYGTDADKGLPPAWYAVVVLARAFAWAFVMWSLWYTPVDNPPVPRDDGDDPDVHRPAEPVAAVGAG
ncbi:hypothetical protein GCM10027055_28860 [Janibacter alkaliphilus]|uniref:Uncharacterized protein n=1 Tax=Janibacter alkaliphilus TaxID=1069963 RepID=A0A852X8A9_9MICO|nr:hypothetical protein [Janibacter alkaliphilus]NYG36534.1 hypothetical protein [Janibacter alkaliphilus]